MYKLSEVDRSRKTEMLRNYSGQKDHYSYRVYRRRNIACNFDTLKFGGPIGQLIATRQEITIRRCLGGKVTGRLILDVGVGTGRVAVPFAEDGAKVIGIDASPMMLEEAASKVDTGVAPHIDLIAGDAHWLPFTSQTFDIVLCLRVLMHVQNWRQVLRELCRVARAEIIFDVPPKSSFAWPQPYLRRLFGTCEEIFRTFTVRELKQELSHHGFEIMSLDRGFVLPFAFHRKVGNPYFSTRIEGTLSKLGLNRVIGGPLTIQAARQT